MKRHKSNTNIGAQVTPEEYELVSHACIDSVMTLKEWLHDAIMEKLERDKERI